MVDKIDSNSTGLRYAQETTPKVVSGSAVWYALEPNSYDSFGPEYTKIPRRPIGPGRQRRKGVTASMEASGGFNQDLTFSNLTRVLQGFFFATAREELTTKTLDGAQVSVTGIATTDDGYSVASGMPAFRLGNLMLVTGATNTVNNGLHVVKADATSTKVTSNTNLTDETPAANAVVLKRVGHQFASATADIVIGADGLPGLSRASGTVDWTTLGLIPGEWVFIGGDEANTKFLNNVGFARVKSVVAALIKFDKTTFTPANETGTGLTVNVFFGDMIKNESDPALIIPRSYQLERTLGNDGVGTQSEYLTGSFCNELTINFPEEDKVNVDLSFVALGHEKRNGTTGVKTGTRPTNTLEEAYNTTVDTTRFRMSLVNPASSLYTPLFSYATEASITINNNVTMNKALTVFGGFDATAGLFEVGGEVSAYFTEVAALQAIEDNKDISLDVWIQRSNQAIMFDIPALQLGDGQLEVEIDEPVKLPLSNEASEGINGATLVFQFFSWLPTLAD